MAEQPDPRYAPPEDFSRRAHIKSLEEYKELYARSLDDPEGFWAEQASAFIIYFNRWIWIVAVLGWGHHLLNRPMRWLPYATEAVYPWYILHQTLILVVGYNLSQLQLGPFVESALVLIATIGGCYVLHEFVIRRVGILRPLFGLK